MMSLRFAPGMRASVSRRASFALVAALALGFVSPRAASADAKSALPPAAGSFKLSKPPVVYNPATLENHIDGEAETVKSYDFKQCAYAEYAPGGKGNQLITADVFQFGGPLDAYGYYSVQRNAAAKVVKVGAEGYQEPSALNFWKGPYYVRLTITASNAPATFQATLPTLAQAIAAKLTGATATPSVVKLLPPGYPPRTDQFRRKNIAAQSYLVNGVSARYPSAGPQAELSISDESSPAVAKSAFGRYQTYLTGAAAAGAKAAPVKGLGEAAVAVRTKFSGNCIAALKGKYIVTIRKAKDPAAALKLAQSAVSKLK